MGQTDLTWLLNSPLPLVVDHATAVKTDFVALATQMDQLFTAKTDNAPKTIPPAVTAGASSKPPNSTGPNHLPLRSHPGLLPVAQGAPESRDMGVD